MQAIVDKVMRAFTHKPPVSDDAAGRGRQEATEFATQLLENFKQQLALQVNAQQQTLQIVCAQTWEHR